jgi:hypothetical protein
MEERPPEWKVAADILISSRGQLRRGGPPAWGLGEVLTIPRRKNLSCYESFTQRAPDVDLGGMHWIELAQDRNMWKTLVNAVMNLRVP